MRQLSTLLTISAVMKMTFIISNEYSTAQFLHTHAKIKIRKKGMYKLTDIMNLLTYSTTGAPFSLFMRKKNTHIHFILFQTRRSSLKNLARAVYVIIQLVCDQDTTVIFEFSRQGVHDMQCSSGLNKTKGHATTKQSLVQDTFWGRLNGKLRFLSFIKIHRFSCRL